MKELVEKQCEDTTLYAKLLNKPGITCIFGAK
jgi:hypothetical protein